MRESVNEFPFTARHRHHRQAIATTQHDQILQAISGVLAQRFQRHRLFEFSEQSHLDLIPARVRRVAVRIVVVVLAIERRRIGMTRAHDLHRPVDPGHLAARMVEERAVPDGEIVAQHVACLVVAHAVPTRCLCR